MFIIRCAKELSLDKIYDSIISSSVIMPREEKTVWMHFQTGKNDKNANIVCCKYCNKSYTFPNATRMEKHLKIRNKYSSCNFVNKDDKAFATTLLNTAHQKCIEINACSGSYKLMQNTSLQDTLFQHLLLRNEAFNT